MARTSRIKFNGAIYHVMVRSISEIDLFNEDVDKEKYLSEMRISQIMYKFKVYGYCMMNNHAHFIIDANGADISKIMQGLNFKYASWFNAKYKRHGHLFQDRFKSKIVDTNRYLIALSAYIHNNPINIKGYENRPEKYKYSSLAVYLGLKKDETGILDEDYIMQLFSSDVKTARKNYKKFVYICNNNKLQEEIQNGIEFRDEKAKYISKKSILIRDVDPEKIIEFLSKETGINRLMIYVKNSRRTKSVRALAILLMRSFCDFRCSEICKLLGNITQSRVSTLCSFGIDLITKNEAYNNIVEKFISNYYNLAT
ncbi:transposase [Haloimpatiens sp. FM7315]|uniref:transposase n=1 Tax=Haloimpatiens sp. FM7315 TaxID=3298609 RepID=UPI0035A3BB69